MQIILDGRGYAHERRREHAHYLKGTIWCGRCYLEDGVNRRLIETHVPRPNGTEYSYFFCRGQQDGTCDFPFSAIDRVEDAIAEHYKTISFTPGFIAAARHRLENALRDQSYSEQLLRDQLTTRLKRLETQEGNLLDLAADGEIDASGVRARLREITRQRKEVGEQLHKVIDDLKPALTYLAAHMSLLASPFELYRHASNETRRALNQAIFERIYVAKDEVVGDEIKTPLRELLAVQRGWLDSEAGSSPSDSRERAEDEASRHLGVPDTKQSTLAGALLTEFESAFGLYPDPSEEVGNLSTASMVPLEGLEPPTLSLGRSCSSIELQRQAPQF